MGTASPSVLLQTDAAAWQVEPGALKPKQEQALRRWGLVSCRWLGPGLEDLPGRIRYRDTGERRHRVGVPLTDLGPVDRFTAPEVVAGGVVSRAADVYLAAAHALALLTAGPVQVTCDDIPLVLSALALFRRDLTPRFIALLQQCLNRDPAGRPETPRLAYRALVDVVQKDLRVATRRLSRKKSTVVSAHRTERGVKPWPNQDRILCVRDLSGGLSALAVLDGVSTADVGTGAFAAETAAQELEPQLRIVCEVPWKYPEAETTFTRLAKDSLVALSKAHMALIGRVFEEFDGQLKPRLRTPVTTCTLALIRGECAVITWTGDSPAFLVRADSVGVLTAASSAGNLAMRDQRSANGYLEHPAPKQLDLPLGTVFVLNEDASDFLYQEEPQLWQVGLRLEPGDFLLLASDGVGDHLGTDAWQRDAFLRRAAAEAQGATDPQAACQCLLGRVFDQAARLDGTDDMSMVVATLGSRPQARTVSSRTSRRVVPGP
jgi:serine/threonine protein phosphatase PrpC